MSGYLFSCADSAAVYTSVLEAVQTDRISAKYELVKPFYEATERSGVNVGMLRQIISAVLSPMPSSLNLVEDECTRQDNEQNPRNIEMQLSIAIIRDERRKT